MEDNKNNFQIKVAKFNLAAEKLKTFRMLIIPMLILSVVMVVVICLTFYNDKSTPIISNSTLEKVVNISELSVYQVTYEGVTEIRDEDLDDVEYLVRYEATAKLKTDFSRIKFGEQDDEKKQLNVYVPNVKLSYDDIILDLDELAEESNYMNFGDDDYDVGSSRILISKCKEDIYNEITHNDGIYELARESAEKTLTSLTKPFVGEYNLNFVWETGE